MVRGRPAHDLKAGISKGHSNRTPRYRLHHPTGHALKVEWRRRSEDTPARPLQIICYCGMNEGLIPFAFPGENDRTWHKGFVGSEFCAFGLGISVFSFPWGGSCDGGGRSWPRKQRKFVARAVVSFSEISTRTKGSGRSDLNEVAVLSIEGRGHAGGGNISGKDDSTPLKGTNGSM